MILIPNNKLPSENQNVVTLRASKLPVHRNKPDFTW
jgi:hypothetical protein